MSYKRTIFEASCIFFPLACSTAAIAADANGFYGGVGIGQSTFRTGEGTIFSLVKSIDGNASNPARAVIYWETKGARVISNRDTGYQVRLGYRFNDNVSLEGGYSDLGKMSFSANQEFVCGLCFFPAGGSPTRQVTGDIRATGLDLDVIGKAPLSDQWSIFGRLGVMEARVKTTAVATPANEVLIQATHSNTSPVFGVGMQWTPSKGEASIPVTARLEWTRYKSLGASNTGESDVDLISMSVFLKF